MIAQTWMEAGERHRLRCGRLVATCSPIMDGRWMWRVDVDEGFGTFGLEQVDTLESAKIGAERVLGKVRDDINIGLGDSLWGC